MGAWDQSSAKAQLRLAAQRLAQLRDRMDAQGRITGKDIATLLQQGNTMLARAKAQKLMSDDVIGDLLEVLEMQIGVLVEHIGELDSSSPTQHVAEAASSIIFVSSRLDLKDLRSIRSLLHDRLGSDFLNSAIANRDSRVPPQVMQAVAAFPASAVELDNYMAGIAQTYGVKWKPELRTEDVLQVLFGMLDKSNAPPEINLTKLRAVCAYGIPDSPSWLRPRTWRLLLGTLPVLKSSWETEANQQRTNYYDLVRRLLEPFSDLPPPKEPLCPLDSSLMDAIKDLFRVPSNLFSGLANEPEPSSICPLDHNAPDDIRINCATNLDKRLRAIHSRDSIDMAAIEKTPLDIGLGYDATPDISVTLSESISEVESHVKTILHSSRSFNTGGAHPRHASALIRLLYIHSCLNPAHHSPHMASLLIPLYSVLNQEMQPEDLCHVEADTFWLFEAMVAEFAELEDEDGGNVWMQKLGTRLEWADAELHADMHAKGLDPSLPHYSYRWLAPILTHTLPLPSVLSIWDALFSRPMTTRDTCPKLEYLLDICTSMLVRARGPLIRLGRSGRTSSGLWSEEHSYTVRSTSLRAWELSDAFTEGMAFLQQYPIEAAGGVDCILQTANDLSRKREEEGKQTKATGLSLGIRLRDTMWRGFTNQVSSPTSSSESSEDEGSYDDGNSTETRQAESIDPTELPQSADQATGLTSRLANVVWKGITNQSAMEELPSPVSATSPLPPSPLTAKPVPSLDPVPPLPSASPSRITPNPAFAPRATVWNYAERLKDSDTAATLAKVSTNWRVKAIQAWSSRSESQSPNQLNHQSTVTKPRSESFSIGNSERVEDDSRRTSLPGIDRSSAYSPPVRPAFFRPPRDSMPPQPRKDSALISSPATDTSDDTSPTTTMNLRDSIVSLQSSGSASASSATRAGPRPLLLNSSSLITGSGSSAATPISRSAASSPGGIQREWSDVTRNRSRNGSQSSISSIDAGRQRKAATRSGTGSDTTESRVIPLNRSSISPLASANRRQTLQLSSNSSRSHGTAVAAPRSVHHSSSPISHNREQTSHKGERVGTPDSPTTLPSSPPPPTPPFSQFPIDDVEVTGTEFQRSLLILDNPQDHESELSTQARKLARRKPSMGTQPTDTSDSSIAGQAPSRTPRVRSKRYPSRPTNLRVQRLDPQRSISSEVMALSPHNLTLPELPDEHDISVTPRAAAFDGTQDEHAGDKSSVVYSASSIARRIRKTSGDGQGDGIIRSRKPSTESGEETRSRKPSSDSHDGRFRKVSTEGIGRVRKSSTEAKDPKGETESAAEEGDDEGYDELLSAYDSEDTANRSRLS